MGSAHSLQPSLILQANDLLRLDFSLCSLLSILNFRVAYMTKEWEISLRYFTTYHVAYI